MATIFNVADYFIEKSHKIAVPVTHLKLQKLCYYAQAWHLALQNQNRLFDDHFEAWLHGPVNPDLFKKYRGYGWNPIDPVSVDPDAFKKMEHKVLEAVWGVYGHLDAKHLETLTHREKPWKEARGNLPDYQYSNTLISEKTMYSYYSKLLEK